MNDQSMCCFLFKCVQLKIKLWRIGKIIGNLILRVFLRRYVFDPISVWEDDISDSDICLNFYTIRKLRDFRTKLCNTEILWRLIFL